MLTQDEVKQHLYRELLALKDKNVAVAWSGGARSSFIWYIAKIDLGLEFKIIFADDDKQDVGLYTHVAKTTRDYDLRIKRVYAIAGNSIQDAASLEADNYDVILTGRKLDWGYCPLPDDEQAVWNYLKTIRVPYYEPKRKSYL